MDKNKLNRRVLLALADIVILNAVKKKPMCRQELSNWFLREFDIPVNGSTLHPVLMKLKDDNLLRIKKEGQKKVFYLTSEGEKLRKSLIKTYNDVHKEVLSFVK